MIDSKKSSRTNSVPKKVKKDGKFGVTGSQTLQRGLDLLEAVANRPASLSDLSKHLQINRSTVHRLASALVERGYLKLVSKEGYMMGAKLLELGYRARQQINIPRVALPHLEALCEQTGDAVHLGVLYEDKALYLDKLSGGRRIEIGSRVGERHPLCSTGLGKSLLLDHSEAEWHEIFQNENGPCPIDEPHFAFWLAKMRSYAAGGYSFDLEENEDKVRCVGAPIRDDTGSIVAAVSVSSVAQYMSDERMYDLIKTVTGTAADISHELGWSGKTETR